MKHFLLIFTAGSLLLSCSSNDTSTTATSSDTSSTVDHSNMNSDTASSGIVMNAGNADFMDIMNRGMQEMKAIKTTGNPDNDFAAMMKAHHMSAIEAAQAEIASGSDQSIKAMAQKMLDDQQKEVAELNTFLSGHAAHGGGEGFHKNAMARMNNSNMNMESPGSVDRQFVTMMIPHHQGAIDMSKAYIKSGAHEPQLKTMANNIIASQQKEITELQKWLTSNK
jgi:uncharacterized protein (DUF305 family)